jgi:hypothetical protein
MSASFRLPVLAAASLLLFAGLALGQIRSGAIIGKVVDSTGGAVPQASITIREEKTNQVYTLTTNDAGDYSQPYLPFGSYEVTARKEGFATISRGGLPLSTAQTIRADLTLSIGTVETQVSVVAAAAELQTDSSHVTNAVDTTIIAAIPNINNNPLNYAVLQPGVVAREAMGNTQSINSFGVGTEGRRTFADFAINGGQAFTNDVQMDGVSVMAAAWNEVSILPNTEGIQEVRTTINNMSAEYGRSQGTVIISSKSGTNEFHGSGTYRIRNEALNANTFANNANQPFTPRVPFKNHAFSGTFGGPVTIPKLYNGRNKTFFFVSYEGFRFKTAMDFFQTVPTALERDGNFSQTLAQVGANYVPVSVYDPFSVSTVSANQYQRTPFPNATIPASRLDPLMHSLMSQFPQANRTPDDPRGVRNFYNRMQQTLVRDAVNTRFDHRVGSLALYGTFGNNLGTIKTPNGWGPQTEAATAGGALKMDRNYYASIGNTWVVSPTTVADMRIGVNRVATDSRANVYNDLDYTKQFGYPTQFFPAIGIYGQYPEMASFGGGFSQISSLNGVSYSAKVERQTNWNLVGSVTRTSGRWTHKWGGEVRSYLPNYIDARGAFTINSSSSFTSGNIIGPLANNINSVTAEKSGSGLASLLLGAGSLAAGENAVHAALAAKYMAFYQQSDWRVADKLTLNLGLRYDIQPGPTERYNRMSSFSFSGQTQGTPGQIMFPGTNGIGRNLYRTPYGDLGPRVGLAYRATSTLVVRSGFGVMYLPQNTGYMPLYYYGNQNFAPKLNDPVALQYGNNPAGALLAPYNQVNTLIPVIGANRNAPQYYGSGSNEPRFDYDHMQNGKVLQWNLFLEKQTHGALLSVGYAGTRGYRLQVGRMTVDNDQLLPDSLRAAWRTAYINSNGVNPGTLVSPNPYQPDPNNLIKYNGSLGTQSMTNRDLAYQYPFFPGNSYGGPVGFSTYNALMVQLSKNYSKGLAFTVHYTWSKAMNLEGSEIQNNNYVENGGLATGSMDYHNEKNSYFLSTNDIPHRLVGTWSWMPPLGKGKSLDAKNRFLNGLIGGWNVGGVLTAQSGQPQQGFTGASGSLTGLADRVSGVPVEVPKELQHWYTGASNAERTVTLPSGRQILVCRYCFLKYSSDAFSGRTVQFPNGTVGNDIYWYGTAAARYGDIRGFGRFNINLSLQKEFQLRERLNLQLSAEASNLLNSAQFRPELNASSGSTFTSVTAAQLAQGIRPGMVQNDSFGTYGMSTFDPRQVELRLRLRF